jgi:hypothetical protein
MRKMFWWGAAGVLASAGAIYLAANHACPNSTTMVLRATPAGDGTTLGAGLGALVSTLDHGVKSVINLNDLCPRQICKLMAEPAAEDCPEVPLGPLPNIEATEPIQIQMTELQPGPQAALSAQVSEGTFAYGYADAEETEAGVATLPMPPVCAPEDAIVMPKIEEPESTDVQAMPYVEEDPAGADASAIPFSAWLFWLKKEAAKIGSSHEQSELVPVVGPMPTVPLQFPEGKYPNTYLPVPAPAVAPVCPPMGYPMPEGVAPMDLNGPPNCQEDPHYHHQYPGCPYTGGCPYQGGHGYPTMKDFAPPQIEKDKKPKKKKKEIKATPTSMLKKLSESLLEDLKNAQSPKRCGLDTMECRPTDAKLPGAGIYDQPF